MDEQKAVDVNEILKKMVQMDGSDLHLTAGMPPVVRVYGELLRMDYPKLMPRDIEDLVYPVLLPGQREQLEKEWELDFSYSVPGVSRFRGNIMWQRGSLAVNFRAVAINIPDMKDLNLPPAVRGLSQLPRGLVLVTGPTGSGKSTTLASIIKLINEEQSLNIVTIENPIEFLHSHKKSIIKQREVGTDTFSFASALRHVLRHDPDVILVGEMRDMESISIALTAAETGHLVYSTLHTQTAPLALHRIIDVFPDSARNQIRQQLADSLQAVLAQQLIHRADGKGRVVAVELLLSTPAVRNLIREGKEHQLYTVMQTSRNTGMQTMDQALAELFLSGKITRDMALEHCVDRVELERVLRRGQY
ncbi:twitching motility protein [Desulfofarcimen acetoxidans DSM 771]|jgi:twitching motility protein PilT|uniref:Twitching motility protein n=1 Tax=Desulfofarcimen acetoxidans (strain ATCC 49208 / DSM 771 / KCTC 5769 / VKM B-1644 / 5575) TaxID=485916 RepID=C8W5J1_DESAS|nr:type IV pilus twitching motility protein PilT [Desulfofarcimen acetoxidans]ACV63991.1 twitching motility protein [Desulfofarcimen acetoxidans DSM 771]